MAAFARTPVLPEAAPVGVLTAQLRHSQRNPHRPLYVDCVEEPPRLTRANSGCDGNRSEGFEPSALCGENWRRERDKLGQFPQILGCGGQYELVFGSVRATEAQSTKPEDALQMSEEHLDLLSFAT
jgi:hypothetical protein